MLVFQASFATFRINKSSHAYAGNDIVGCPICESRVKYSKLNEHIDSGCKDPSASVKTWSKILAGSKKGKNKYVRGDSFKKFLCLRFFSI